MSEPYDYRAANPSGPGRPQGWTGTSRMPAQSLGTASQDQRPSSDYPPYGSPGRPSGGRSGGGQFRPDRSRLVDYTLKGLGLLGVALVAGFLWFLVRNDPATPAQAHTSSPTAPAGVYAFQPYQPASTVGDCADHATDKVKDFLESHTCLSLRRSLFTASLTNGQEIVTSVAVVRMSAPADAAALEAISDTDQTGHVKDLVEEGKVIPNGPDTLQEAGYYSLQRGSRLVIVMTEYVDGTLDNPANLAAKDKLLKAVSADAAKQGIGLGD